MLILACSEKKRGLVDFAAELYDGPAFRVLRASGWPDTDHGPDCRVHILSAELGLLGAWSTIERYDRKMDARRANELAAEDPHEIRGHLFGTYSRKVGRGRFEEREHFGTSEVLFYGGALYRSVIQAWAAVGVFDNCPGGVTYTSGGIGEQLGQLKRWLTARGGYRPAGEVAA